MGFFVVKTHNKEKIEILLHVSQLPNLFQRNQVVQGMASSRGRLPAPSSGPAGNQSRPKRQELRHFYRKEKRNGDDFVRPGAQIRITPDGFVVVVHLKVVFYPLEQG